MWNKRYSVDKYVYGEFPNEFFKEQLDKMIPGNILLPAEGEGRNAVYAAKCGWNVTAFDSSNVGRKKALDLAKRNKVNINYIVSSFEDFSSDSQFDLIALIYAHTTNRNRNHSLLSKFLKMGGTIILEGFTKKQLENNTGGPKNIEMLFAQNELGSDFNYLNNLMFWELEKELKEGDFHNGNASIIRMIGTKNY